VHQKLFKILEAPECFDHDDFASLISQYVGLNEINCTTVADLNLCSDGFWGMSVAPPFHKFNFLFVKFDSLKSKASYLVSLVAVEHLCLTLECVALCSFAKTFCPVTCNVTDDNVKLSYLAATAGINNIETCADAIEAVGCFDADYGVYLRHLCPCSCSSGELGQFINFAPAEKSSDATFTINFP
jgi:hypothetical protein